MLELAAYRELSAGWDGEAATPPTTAAIDDAMRFVRIAGFADGDVEPTLHVDGSVILEVADDLGSLRFKGDKQIIYTLSGAGHGVAPFDGFTVPEAIGASLPI